MTKREVRARVRVISGSAFACLSIAALPAFSQVELPQAPPLPDPIGAPAPITITPEPPAPAQVAAPTASAASDMAGSIGFGVGVIAATQLVGTANQVAIKYWINDTLAIVPALSLSLTKSMGTDARWSVAPEAVFLFVPLAGASTRFLAGGGLGIGLQKTPTIPPLPPADTLLHIYLPIQAGVEHFFARWFSMGIAARMNLFDYTRQGDPWTMTFNINTASLLGSLFIYTD